MKPEDEKRVDELIANRLEAEGIVNIFEAMDEREKETLATHISRYMFERQQAQRTPENFYTPRFLWEGQDIDHSTSSSRDVPSQVGHPGPTLPRVVNLLGGGVQGSLEPGNGEQLNITFRGGAGTDCMFDAIASTCWAAEVAAGRGAEGQVFKSLSGCDFRVYSTLNGAVQGMIALGGHTKILMCNSETLTAAIDFTGVADIRIFGLGANQVGISGGGAADGAPVVITGASGAHIFSKTGDGASGNGNGVGFQGLSFATAPAETGRALFRFTNTSNFDWLEYSDCFFAVAGPLAFGDGGTANLGFDLKVTDCVGSADSFFYTTGLLVGADNLYAHGNILSLINFYDNDFDLGTPGRAWFEGGRYAVSSNTNLGGVNNIFQCREMTIETTATVFTTEAEQQSCKNFVFQNLTIIATGDAAKFANFGSHAGNFCRGLFIDGVYGHTNGVANPSGAFLTVENTWQDVFIGSIGQYGGWSPTYSGPTPTAGITHTLLDANQHSDTALDSVTRGSLIYGNSTPAWDELVHPGAAGQVLYANATDALWTPNPKVTGYGRFGSASDLTGATTAGDLTVIRQFIEDANFSLQLVGGDPQIIFDTGDDVWKFNRSSSTYEFLIANNTVVEIGPTTISASVRVEAAASVLAGSFVRVGDTVNPTNTTTGDLTATRLIVPNGALVHSAVSQVLGNFVMKDLSAILFSDTDDSNYVGLRAPTVAQSENYIYELPDDDPVAAQVLAVKSTAASPVITTEWVAQSGGGATAQREYIRAEMMVPKVASPAPPAQRIDAGSNDVTYRGIPFDAAADEFATYNFALPSNYDAGTLTAKFYWTALSGSGDVIWGIQMMAASEGDAINTAMGTAVTVTDTLTTASDVHLSATSGAITPSGTAAAGDMLFVEIYRDANAGGDTLAVDAYLLGVELIFGISGSPA